MLLPRDESLVRGHRNVSSKLTDAQVLEIREAQGLHSVIASRFGVTRAHVGNIKHRRIWKHLA